MLRRYRLYRVWNYLQLIEVGIGVMETHTDSPSGIVVYHGLIF